MNLKSKTMVRLHGDRSSLLNALMRATSRHNRLQSQAHHSLAKTATMTFQKREARKIDKDAAFLKQRS